MRFKKITVESTAEEHVDVYALKHSTVAQQIEKLVTSYKSELIGYTDREAVYLTPEDVSCFIAEDGKVFALSAKGKLLLRERLYQLEERLPIGFIRINQSAIANIAEIERFDVSISGTLGVKFKNGYRDYVSRRNLKNVKERLGL